MGVVPRSTAPLSVKKPCGVFVQVQVGKDQPVPDGLRVTAILTAKEMYGLGQRWKAGELERQADAPADVDRPQLALPDEFVDRRSAEREEVGCGGDVHEERLWAGGVGLAAGRWIEWACRAVRCWERHFDSARRIALNGPLTRNQSRSRGITLCLHGSSRAGPPERLPELPAFGRRWSVSAVGSSVTVACQGCLMLSASRSKVTECHA